MEEGRLWRNILFSPQLLRFFLLFRNLEYHFGWCDRTKDAGI